MTSAQPSASSAQPLDHARGGVVLAPDEHGRAGAGDRGAERAELRRAGGERHRLGVELRAARLVQAVGEPAGDEVEPALGQPEHEQRRVGDVEDRVGHRHLGGQRGARLGGAHVAVRDDDHRLEPGGRVEALGAAAARRSRSRRAARRRRCRRGPRARPRAGGCRRRARRSSRRRAARRRRRRRSCRARRRAGCRSVMRNSKSSGDARRAKPRTTRLRRSRAIERSVTTAKCPVSTTSTSMCRASAAARTSKPGPRLAEEAGTRMRRRRLTTRARPSRPRRSRARTAPPSPRGRARPAGP